MARPDRNSATPRAVFITGASRGIGEATAALLRDRGFRVFAGVRGTDQAARAACAGLHPVQADITDDAAVRAAADQVASALGEGGLHGLVNNACSVVPGPLECLPLARFREQLETGLVGQLSVIQSFLPLLRRTGGRVVNVGSVSGRVPSPYLGAYGTAKYAVEGMSDALRLELDAWRIPVIVIQPGAIATTMSEQMCDEVDRIIEELPDGGRLLYTEVFRRSAQRIAANHARGASAPEVVARAILAALTDRRPRTRYPVGAHASVLLAAARLLPDRHVDALVKRFLR
jgi:NAD(P)-dependent dehydrogenase (short-subunit alcohol dehydrogenase family)